MTPVKVGIATIGDKGLQDQVSQTFGRTETFTIVSIENDKVKEVRVLENSAFSLSHGRGPVVIRLLIKERVNVVIASEFGPGLSVLLEQHGIKRVKVKPKTPVTNVIREFAFSFAQTRY